MLVDGVEENKDEEGKEAGEVRVVALYRKVVSCWRGKIDSL